MASYCADHLPDFLKTTEAYKEGNFEKALVDAYLGFDQLLTKPDIVKVLHTIAGNFCYFNSGFLNVRWLEFFNSGNKNQTEPSEDDPDEMSDLYEEATMSIEDLIMKYGKKVRENLEAGGDVNSKNSSLEYVMSKVLSSRAKKGKKAAEEAENEEKTSDSVEGEDSVKTETTAKTESSTEDKKETNGNSQNGTDNHNSKSDHELPTSSKGTEIYNALFIFILISIYFLNMNSVRQGNR